MHRPPVAIHRPPSPGVLLLPACLALAMWPASPARAEVKRCERPDGQTVFTDKPCTEVGAVERLPRSETATGARTAVRSGCARNLQDLVYEMTSAIDGRDANRLAGVYHWAGMSSDSAYRVLARLDAIAQRPLVDIVPVMPAPPPEPVPPASVAATPSSLPASTVASTTTTTRAEAADPAPAPPADPTLYPQTTVRQAPVALRVEQTIGNSATPSRTVFGLRRHMGCYWISL